MPFIPLTLGLPVLYKPGDDQPNSGCKDKTCGDLSKNVHRGIIDLIALDGAFIGHHHEQKHQRRSRKSLHYPGKDQNFIGLRPIKLCLPHHRKYHDGAVKLLGLLGSRTQPVFPSHWSGPSHTLRPWS
jgi:hypothetical protein